MATSAELTVADDAEQGRYEARRGSEVVGFITYRDHPGQRALIHVEVPPPLEGQGIGTRLVAGALDDIRRRGLSVEPVCPFVVDFLQSHPEYADLVAPT
jgi:uncharacterized protein